MANHLPGNDYAFFYSVFSLLSFSAVLFRAGASDVILYELPGILSMNRRREAGMIYRFTLRFQLLLASAGFVLFCAAVPFLERYFFAFPVDTGCLLLFFVVIWGLVLEDTTLAALNSLKKFGTASLLRLLKTGLFCLAVWMCLRRNSLFGIIVSFVSMTTLCTLAGDRLVMRREKFKNGGAIPPRIRRKVIGGGMVYLLLSGGHALYRDFGALSVAFFSTAEEVVLFNIALPVAMIVLSFGIVLQVFTPMIADCFVKGEKNRLKRLMRLMLSLSAAAMLGALFVLSLWGEDIIRLLFSAKFAAAKYCVLFLVESAILTMPVSVFLSFFNAAGRKATSGRTLLPAAAVALAAFPALSHAGGAAGAGVATLITVGTWLGACLVYYVKFMQSWTGNE